MKAKIKLILLLISYVISGASITFISKFLYKQESIGILFFHDWLITLFMFFSETFALVVYYIKNRKSKSDSKQEIDQAKSEDKLLVAENESKQIPFKQIIFFTMIASFLDSFATSLGNISLNITRGSYLIFLKSLFLIMIIFVCSWIKAKKYKKEKKPITDHMIGFVVAFIALILFILSAFIGNKNNDEFIDFIIPFGMMLLAMILQSIQFLIEENKIRTLMIHQFVFIGFEGVFGFFFNIVMCIIFYFIDCNPEIKYADKICSKDNNGNLKLENSIFAFKQIYENYTILILLIVLMIFIAVYNMISISIIKYGGALTRGLIENIRTIVIWIFFLIPWVSDSLEENFNWFRLVGVLTIIASLLFFFSVFKIDEKKTIKSKISALSFSSINEISQSDPNDEDDESITKEDNDNLNELENK